MPTLPSVPVAAVHESMLIVLIVLGIVQFLIYRSRLKVLSQRIARQDQDFEQLRKDLDLMEREANYDSLTRLPNRRHFECRLQSVLSQLSTGHQECSVMMIDFDNFKSINDTFGHQAGDRVLKTLADQLRELFSPQEQPSESLCARYGGDEFAVILPGYGSQTAGEFAERLRHRIESLRLEFQGRICPLTVSIGFATFPNHTSEPCSLLELADRSLYRAKTNGRNQVCRPTGEMDLPNERETS